MYQLTSRFANNTVIGGTRCTTMLPMPDSGAARNKGYSSGDFSGSTARAVRLSWRHQIRSIRAARELPDSAPSSKPPGCHAAPLPKPGSLARVVVKDLYPGVRMQKISPAHRVPAECAECGWPGTVTVRQTIQADRAVLVWCCIACNAEWPLRDREETPRSLRVVRSEDPGS